MGDDRPKKSWRELDSARDKGGSRPRRDPDARSREKTESSAAYKSYKSNLDKLFTPGSGTSLLEEMKAKLGPPSADAQAKQALTVALNDKADLPSLVAFLDGGLTLPADGRLLLRLLDVPDPARLVPVLRALLEVVEGGQKPSRMLLIQKLDALILRLGNGPAVELAQQVRAELG
jgi:hypothetical protein